MGLLKPNDLGLFDMHGNAGSGVKMSYKAYGKGGDGKATEDIEDIRDISSSEGRVLRGGSFFDPASTCVLPTALRHGADAPKLYNNGFRPARTFIPSPPSAP